MSEHRVSMLGASWRRLEDPTRSRDPRVQAVVGALATLPAPAPRPEFRAELRAQLVAIAPRLIADGVDAETPMIDIVPRPEPTRRPSPRPAAEPRRRERAERARHTDSVFARARAIPLGRPLSVAASVLVAFALMLGGAVWMSQKALPGDALYGLKRASERVELATAGSDTAKAGDYLEFAARRADEVQGLVHRTTATAAGPGLGADGAVNASTARLISSTLASADSDVKSATALLGEQAVRSSSTGPLDTLTSWAPGQLQRLRTIAAAMPDRSLRDRAESSAHLVKAAVTRASELKPKLGCSCLDSAPKDSLGPVPCTVCTVPSATLPAPTGGQVGHPAKTSAAPKPARQHTDGGAGPGVLTSKSAPPSSAAGPDPATTTKPNPGISLPLPLPTLSLPTKSLPVSVNSCGADVKLPIIGIEIGLCSGVHVSVHP